MILVQALAYELSLDRARQLEHVSTGHAPRGSHRTTARPAGPRTRLRLRRPSPQR